MKDIIKTHTSLIIIIVAGLLIELTTGVVYYHSQKILRQTTINVMERENNALYLNIRNKLAEVEVMIDNMSWIVTDDLSHSDSLFRAAYQITENNPQILGSCIVCIPNLYSERGYWFEPYAVRRPDGTIKTMQLGSASHDYTKMEFFTIPLATGTGHWCEPYMDNVGAHTFITTYGMPVRNRKGEYVAVVEADLSLDWLEDMINENKIHASNQRFLVTGHYNLLSGDDGDLYRKALKVVMEDDDHEGNVTLKDERGRNKIVLYTPVGGKTDWILINVLDENDIFAKLRRVRLNLFLMVLAGMLLTGFIVWRSKRNLQSLREMNAEKERISSELRVATQIQQSLLPHSYMKCDDVNVVGLLMPAREVGGDLFDYFIRDGKLFFCIGDVSGKGTPAAILMAGTSSLFRAFSTHENSPAHIMHLINESACQGNDTNMFATLFIGVLDLPSGHLRYCDAGHDLPIVLNDQSSIDNGLQSLKCNPHLPVGLFDDVKYTVQETFLTSDSTLFLYTDGLTEAKNLERKLFGLQRVEVVLKKCVEDHLSPKEILDTMTKEVHDFVKNAEQSDDLTMLAIRYTPQRFECIFDETITLKNDLSEVSRLSTFQKTVLEKMKIEKSLARQIRLAVEEAVVNVMEYAYPIGVDGNVEVNMMSDGKCLKVLITDSGVPFDPTMKEEGDISLSVEDRQIGGLGIHLLRKLMDSVNYEHLNGRNTLTLMKNISSDLTT